jgi:hypothetical protein
LITDFPLGHEKRRERTIKENVIDVDEAGCKD